MACIHQEGLFNALSTGNLAKGQANPNYIELVPDSVEH